MSLISNNTATILTDSLSTIKDLLQQYNLTISEDKLQYLTQYLPTIPNIATLNSNDLYQIIIILLSLYGLYTLSKSLFTKMCPNITIQSLMRLIPGAQDQFKKEVATQVQGMLKPIIPYQEQLRTIPTNGLTPAQLLTHCHKLHYNDVKPDGSAFAYVYETDFNEINDTVEKIFNMFSNTNALSPIAFPSLRYMENCIISACATLLHLPQPDLYEQLQFTQENNMTDINSSTKSTIDTNYTGAVGAVTSGGTESIICALKTHRDRAKDLWNITEPEIIAPITIHPAFTKGAHILNIKIHLIPLDESNNYKVNMKKYTSKINSNTILLIGSAPAYPHGIIDPISEICALAKYYKIPVHVDACIGGFFLPFVEMLQQQQLIINDTQSPITKSMNNNNSKGTKNNNNNNNTNTANNYDINNIVPTKTIPIWDFRHPEVLSISLDLHKYAYTPKGASCIMYRSNDIRKYQYFSQSNWPGGLFVSPSLLGTRGGGSIAASFASLQLYGMNGYMKLTQDVLLAKKIFIDTILTFPELEIIGYNHTNNNNNINNNINNEQFPFSSIISWKVKDEYCTKLNILTIGDALELSEMKFKDETIYKPSVKWVIERQQNPNSIHMTLMAQHIHTCHKFKTDLTYAIRYVYENMHNMLNKGSAGMYGMVVNVSKVSSTLIEEFLLEFETQVMSQDRPVIIDDGKNDNVKKNDDDKDKNDIKKSKSTRKKGD